MSWNRVCTQEPRRASPLTSSLEVGACPNQLAARRSAVLRARLAACRAPCPAAKAPPNPAGPRQSGGAPAPVARAARVALPSSKRGSASRDGPRCPASPRPPTEDSGPVLGPCALPNPEAEAEAEAESRRGPRLLRVKSSSPHIDRVFTASGTCSPCGWNTRGSQTARPRLERRRQSSSMPRTRQAIRTAAPSLRLLGSDRMQPVARHRSSVQPVAAWAVRSGIVHRWHSLSQGRGGQGINSVQLQMWVGGGLGPGADVGEYEPSPVVSDARSPQRRCGRIGVSRTKLRRAVHTEHVHETCSPSGRNANSAPRAYSAAGVSTQQTRHSVRRRRRTHGTCMRPARRAAERPTVRRATIIVPRV